MSSTNARLQGGGLILPRGSAPGSVNVGESALIIDSDGSVKTQDSAGVKTSLGGADCVRTTLLAPATTITVSGLDGNNDGDYRIYFHLLGASNTGVPFLQINGVDTSLYASWVEEVSASTVQGNRSATSWQMGPALAATDNMAGWLYLHSRAGDPGPWRVGHGTIITTSGPTSRDIKLLYQDNTTNIASLVLNGASNSLATGSYLQVEKLHRTYP